MDGSFFALGLIGALLGYIVGDFQRERRYRRDARANLARANDRTNTNTNVDAHHGAGTRADSYSNGAAHYVNEQRRQARRRAVRGDNGWARPNPSPAGRYLRGADETPVMAGRGWEFDGD